MPTDLEIKEIFNRLYKFVYDIFKHFTKTDDSNKIIPYNKELVDDEDIKNTTDKISISNLQKYCTEYNTDLQNIIDNLEKIKTHITTWDQQKPVQIIKYINFLYNDQHRFTTSHIDIKNINTNVTNATETEADSKKKKIINIFEYGLFYGLLQDTTAQHNSLGGSYTVLPSLKLLL
jgi:L-2-hydroxyglutarate oxidase LhgO